MQLINKFSFEVRTELRSYQFVLNPDSPIDELLFVLDSIREHYQKIKDEADAKAKESSEKPPQE